MEEKGLSEIEREVLEKVAKFIAERGLSAPAVLFLEMHRPLANIGGHAILMASPLLGPILGMPIVEAFYRALSKPEGLDYLIEKLEELGKEGKGGGERG